MQIEKEFESEKNHATIYFEKLKNLGKTTKQEKPIPAVDNKNLFLKKYSINMEIPSCKILDTKFYKKDSRYSLQLTNFIIPGVEKESKPKRSVNIASMVAARAASPIKSLEASEHKEKKKSFFKGLEHGIENGLGKISTMLSTSERRENKVDAPPAPKETIKEKKYKVVTHDDGNTEESTLPEIFKDFVEGVILRLFFKDEKNSVVLKDTVVLGKHERTTVKHAFLKIRGDSKYMGILLQELNQLKIYRIEESTDGPHPLHQVFEDLRNDNFVMQLSNQDLSWVRAIEFDRQSEILLLQGLSKI